MKDFIKIDIQDQDAQKLLRKIERKCGSMRPLMRQCSGIMLDDVEENFEQQGRPPWKPLKPARQSSGKKKGALAFLKGKNNVGTRKILQKSGSMASNITPDSTDTQATVASNKIYAPIQHFGGRAGRNRSAVIPARPFMVMSAEGMEEITLAAKKYVER